jgi:hypothetical protein
MWRCKLAELFINIGVELSSGDHLKSLVTLVISVCNNKLDIAISIFTILNLYLS